MLLNNSSLLHPVLASEIYTKSKKGEESAKLGKYVLKTRGLLRRRAFLTNLKFVYTKLILDKQLVILLALEADSITEIPGHFVDPEVAAKVLEVPLEEVNAFLKHLKQFIGFPTSK